MTHERFVPALHLVESLPVGVLNAQHLMLGLAPHGHSLLGEILAFGVDSDLVALLQVGDFHFCTRFTSSLVFTVMVLESFLASLGVMLIEE